MPLPDISDLSTMELAELGRQIALQYKQSTAAKEFSDASNRAKINEAIDDLNTLLGEVGVAPNLDSIRGVMGYSDQQLAENSGLALRLVLIGMERLTQTVLDIAHVISD